MKAAVYAACVLEGKEVGEDEVAVNVRYAALPRPLSHARARVLGQMRKQAPFARRRRRRLLQLRAAQKMRPPLHSVDRLRA